MIDPERIEWWQCTIGPVKRKEIDWGGDFPLRSAVKEKFEEIFNTVEYEISSGWGTTAEVKDIISTIRNLAIADPSGETLRRIKAVLDESTTRRTTQVQPD